MASWLIRMLLERAVVGCDCRVVLALSRQRIAQVVQPLIGWHRFERLLRRRKIAFAIRLHTGIKTLLLHLIGTLPQAAIGRVRRLRQRQHADHRQHCHHRAAAKRQQGQQHHRQHQPIAFVEPDIATVGLGGFICQWLL